MASSEVVLSAHHGCPFLRGSFFELFNPSTKLFGLHPFLIPPSSEAAKTLSEPEVVDPLFLQGLLEVRFFKMGKFFGSRETSDVDNSLDFVLFKEAEKIVLLPVRMSDIPDFHGRS